ncbi:hypothetical protein RR46_13193 [Papilio xuthus]|uniref:Uncharacterized protein n=1 Tax=Papilio xuthus TaxID=66420 RepID=A0A194PM14_PAPXU|nr:hypothetical protein RR46_13193 [Papilio xuthus]
MKKCKENKKTSTPKPKAKPLDHCKNCASKYCPGSTKLISQKRSNLTPKASKTSIGTKASKMSTTNKCNCTSYLDHAAMLDMMTDDNICSCGIFAKALRSNIHMNIGTLIHQEECNTATEDNVMEEN